MNVYTMTCTKTIRSISARLVGGSSTREGRLEVYYSGQWGTVCDDEFTDASARVACNMLGFGYDVVAILFNIFYIARMYAAYTRLLAILNQL